MAYQRFDSGGSGGSDDDETTQDTTDSTTSDSTQDDFTSTSEPVGVEPAPGSDYGGGGSDDDETTQDTTDSTESTDSTTDDGGGSGGGGGETTSEPVGVEPAGGSDRGTEPTEPTGGDDLGFSGGESGGDLDGGGVQVDDGQADGTPALDRELNRPSGDVSTTGVQGLETQNQAAPGQVDSQATEYEEYVLNVLGGNYSQEDVRVYETGDGMLNWEFTAQGRQQRQEIARRKQTNALVGLGFGITAGGEFVAPDAPGPGTPAEQRRQTVESRVEGLLDSPGQAAGDYFERQRQEAQEMVNRRVESLTGDAFGQERMAESYLAANRESLKEDVASSMEDQLAEQGQEVDLTAEDVTLRVENGSIEASLSEEGQQTVQETEQFGDIDWTPLVEGDPIEDAVDTAGETVTDVGYAVGDTVFDNRYMQGPVTGAVGNLGEGATKGVTAIANIPALVGTGLEGVEYGAYGVNKTVEGELGEFADQSVQQGGRIGQAALEQAAENPLETVGMLGGALIGSYGAMRLAARQSARAGAAARWAIQPGEEALGYGGYYATRATAGTRAADRFFPNKEPLIFSEEAAIRGAKRLGSRVRGGTPDFERPSFGRTRSLRGQVSVEADPEAGFLEIDPDLKQQLNEATVGRAQSGAQTVRDLPSTVGDVSRRTRARAGEGARNTVDRVLDMDAQEFVDDAARQAGRGVGRVETTARQGFTRADLQAEDLGYRLGQRTRGGVDRALDFDGQEFVNTAARQAGRRVGGLETTARQRYTQAELALGDARVRAGARANAALDSVLDMSPRDFTRDAAQRARRGAGTRVDRLMEFTAGRTDAGHGDVALQQAFLRGSQMPSLIDADPGDVLTAGRRGASRVRSGLESRGRQLALASPSVTGDAALQQAFLRGSNLPFPSRSFEFDLLGDRDIRGGARRELESLRFGLAERAASGRRGLGNLRDVTIRVGDTDRATLYETEFGSNEPAIRSQLDNPLGIESETDLESESDTTTETGEGEGGDGMVGVDVDSEVDSGTGQVMLARSETRSETPTEARSDVQGERRNVDAERPPGFEPAFTGEDTRPSVGDTQQPPGVDSLDWTDFEIGTRVGGRTGLGLDRQLDIARDVYGQAFGQEFRQDLSVNQDTSQETELRVRTETETEAETEQENENEVEVEAEGGNWWEEDRPPRDDDPGFSGGGRGDLDVGPSAGYFAEFITAYGTGAGIREAADVDGGEYALTEQRPTELMVSGTQEQQAQIEAAQDFFGFTELAGDDGL